MAGSVPRCAILMAALFATASGGVAVAATGVQRSFVASYGLPTNTAFNCSIAKPCRAFAEAISVTSSGGEVVVLDSAGYGPVTINQSVSIVAPHGVYAGISVFTGSGITVAAGSGDTVILRGLSINNQGGINNIAGILVSSAGTMVIDRCNLNAMTTAISGQTTVATRFLISDTTMRNGGGGVSVSPQNAAAADSTLDVSRSLFQDNTGGVTIFTITQATITDSVFEGQVSGAVGIFATALSTADATVAIDRSEITGGASGVFASSSSGFRAVANISNSVITNNFATGLSAGSNGIIRVMESQITGNGTGTAVSGSPLGVIESLQTSMRTGNTTNGVAATPIAPY